MAEMVYNLTNANVSLVGGKIKLGPRGSSTDHAEITNEQAAAPDVVAMKVSMRIRLMGVEAAAQHETASKKAAKSVGFKSKSKPPKAESKPEPEPEPEPKPEPEPEKKSDVDEAVTNDTERKGKKSKKSRSRKG